MGTATPLIDGLNDLIFGGLSLQIVSGSVHSVTTDFEHII